MVQAISLVEVGYIELDPPRLATVLIFRPGLTHIPFKTVTQPLVRLNPKHRCVEVVGHFGLKFRLLYQILYLHLHHMISGACVIRSLIGNIEGVPG
jgi:hypothetical protein